MFEKDDVIKKIKKQYDETVNEFKLDGMKFFIKHPFLTVAVIATAVAATVAIGVTYKKSQSHT